MSGFQVVFEVDGEVTRAEDVQQDQNEDEESSETEENS